MSSEDRPTAIIAAFLANLGIAVAKFVAFAFTRSSAMLAEGIHSVADTGNQALLLVGRQRARRQADEAHPFGYGHEVYFWSFLVAVVLFTVGALFSLWEGYEKLRHPHPVESPAWAIGVLVVSMVFESISLRTAVNEIGPGKRGTWWQYVRRTRSPENAVVLLEDTAAETGLLFALTGVTLAAVTHDAHWDALGSLAIGVLLAGVAAVLAVEMKSLLIGEAAERGDIRRLRAAIEADPRVECLVELRTMHLGPTDLLVAARVELDAALTFDEVAAAVDDLTAAMRDAVPSARQVYVEPDNYTGWRWPEDGKPGAGVRDATDG